MRKFPLVKATRHVTEIASLHCVPLPPPSFFFKSALEIKKERGTFNNNKINV